MTTKTSYKQTEIGIIPSDWEPTRLDTLAKRGSGHTPNKKMPEYWNGNVRWISLKDTEYLDRGYIDQTSEQITAAGLAHSSATLHPAETVVLSRDAGVGRCAIMKCAMAVSQHFIAWHCGQDLDNRFLYYWLQGQKPELERIAMGNTIKTIGLGYFKEMKVPKPDVKEQRAIAVALSDADEWIASLDRLIAKKRDIKQATMQQLLTGKTRLPRFEKRTAHKQTAIGNIPEDWELVPLSDLLDFKNGLNAQKEAYGQGTPFINVLEVIKNTHLVFSDIPGKISVESDTLALYQIRVGDILFNRTSETQDEVGLAAVYSDSKTVVFGGFVIRGRITSRRLDSQFSGYALRAPSVRKQIISKGQGAVRANIGQSDLSDVMFPLPTTEEQLGIAEILSSIDAEVATLKAQRDKACAIKQGMMQELLTGRVRLI